MSHVSAMNGKTGNLTAADVFGDVPTGTNTRMGTATLVAGTVTVNNTLAKTTSLVMVSRKTSGGTAGHLSATAAAGSFTITSSSATDTSEVVWQLYEPAS